MNHTKRIALFSATTLCLFLSAGCVHSQQIAPAPVLSCPAPNSPAYAQINAGTTNGGPVTATNYTDAPGIGSNCYFVQTLDGSGVSVASNIPPPLTTSASLTHVALTWSAPTAYTCVSGCKYVVSRAAAVQTAVGAPSNLAPSATALATPPDLRSPSKLELVARR